MWQLSCMLTESSDHSSVNELRLIFVISAYAMFGLAYYFCSPQLGMKVCEAVLLDAVGQCLCRSTNVANSPATGL